MKFDFRVKFQIKNSKIMIVKNVNANLMVSGSDMDDMDRAANRQRMIVKIIDNFSRDFCESWHRGSPGKSK